MLNLDFEFL